MSENMLNRTMQAAYAQITEASLSEAAINNLVSVFRDARIAHLQFLLELHDAGEDREFLRRVVLPENEFWMAEVGGQCAGFLAFAKGWLNHLYVAPRFQGQGIGTYLLAIAKRANPSLQLWVFEVNHPAIRFYQRNGFQVVEQTAGVANEAKMPDVRMRWDSDGNG